MEEKDYWDPETWEMIKDTKCEWKEYIKKPVVIKATKMEEEFDVNTLEGLMHGREGDYLVKGIAGELYPVRREIFEQTYDEVKKEGHNSEEIKRD